MEDATLPRIDAETADGLVVFLSGEAAADDWQRRRARLLALQAESRPAVRLHAERVARTARLLAEEVGFAAAAAEALHDAALLHDVGKLAVPEAVLYKSGALDEAERREMRMHAAYGFALLDVAGAPQAALDVARYHHERYGDDAGYFGVSGESIPYAARIVAVADVHEALTARREYKPPIPEGEALAMMTANSEPPALGRAAFDPFLLRRFVALRLRDPSLEATAGRRAELEAFARSDPMADLPRRGDLLITRAGDRLHYGLDGAGCRILLAMTRSDGSKSTELPRLAALAASREALPAPGLGF